jgi:hypothetical protein
VYGVTEEKTIGIYWHQNLQIFYQVGKQCKSTYRGRMFRVLGRSLKEYAMSQSARPQLEKFASGGKVTSYIVSLLSDGRFRRSSRPTA